MDTIVEANATNLAPVAGEAEKLTRDSQLDSTIGQTASDQFAHLPKTPEGPTIGIVLCQDKSDSMVELTLPKGNDQIFASRYQTVLPSKEELRKLMSDSAANYVREMDTHE